MRVKICGMNDQEELRAAAALGADGVGFLVGITHLAEDKVTVSKAAALIKTLPPFVTPVAVTHLTSSARIIPMLQRMRVSVVQLHSDISIEEISKVRAALPYIRVIKLVSVTGEEAVAEAKRFEKAADALLLDTRTAERLGGTGQTHDWSISRRIAAGARVPVILAGGLRPENLKEAIEAVRPYAVDVNSGVETPDGRKDPAKMKAFIEIAHSY